VARRGGRLGDETLQPRLLEQLHDGLEAAVSAGNVLADGLDARLRRRCEPLCDEVLGCRRWCAGRATL